MRRQNMFIFLSTIPETSVRQTIMKKNNNKKRTTKIITIIVLNMEQFGFTIGNVPKGKDEMETV